VVVLSKTRGRPVGNTGAEVLPTSTTNTGKIFFYFRKHCKKKIIIIIKKEDRY